MQLVDLAEELLRSVGSGGAAQDGAIVGIHGDGGFVRELHGLRQVLWGRS